MASTVFFTCEISILFQFSLLWVLDYSCHVVPVPSFTFSFKLLNYFQVLWWLGQGVLILFLCLPTLPHSGVSSFVLCAMVLGRSRVYPSCVEPSPFVSAFAWLEYPLPYSLSSFWVSVCGFWNVLLLTCAWLSLSDFSDLWKCFFLGHFS
jgi:hypothetical protein